MIYASALVLYTAYAYWYLAVYMPAFEQVSGMDFTGALGSAIWIFGIPAYLAVAGPFAVLVVRPMWWAKPMMLMFLLSAPMAWFVSSFIGVVEPTLRPAFNTAANFAYAFAALAVVHQIIDPTVWRAPNTWLSKDYPPPWPFQRGARRPVS